MGIIKMPNFSGSDSKYRPCLQEFYADWAPEKLGSLDDTLFKYKACCSRAATSSPPAPPPRWSFEG